MKLYNYRLEEYKLNRWQPCKCNGEYMFITITDHDATILNTPCRGDRRWVLSSIEDKG